MSQQAESPVLTLKEAALYIRRTERAMYHLRDRGTGPECFRKAGRIYYRIAALDDWLAHGEATDEKCNPELNPVNAPVRKRRPSRSNIPAFAA